MKRSLKALIISICLVLLWNAKAFAFTETIPTKPGGGEVIVPPTPPGDEGGGKKKPIVVYENSYDHPKHIYIDNYNFSTSKRGEMETYETDKDGNTIIKICYFIKHYIDEEWTSNFTKNVVIEKKEMDVSYKLEIRGPEGSASSTVYSKVQEAFSPSNADGIGGNPSGKAVKGANIFYTMESAPPGKYHGKGYGYRHYYSSSREDTYTEFFKKYTNGYTTSYSSLKSYGTPVIKNSYEWEHRYIKDYIISSDPLPPDPKDPDAPPKYPLGEIVEEKIDIPTTEVIIF